MSQYEDDADLLSEECANCGELRGACDCVEPAESDRIDLKQVANMLYDLFRSAPISATINGEGGRAAFYDRDAQRAQALIILTKIWQAARATPSPEPPKTSMSDFVEAQHAWWMAFSKPLDEIDALTGRWAVYCDGEFITDLRRYVERLLKDVKGALAKASPDPPRQTQGFVEWSRAWFERNKVSSADFYVPDMLRDFYAEFFAYTEQLKFERKLLETPARSFPKPLSAEEFHRIRVPNLPLPPGFGNFAEAYARYRLLATPLAAPSSHSEPELVIRQQEREKVCREIEEYAGQLFANPFKGIELQPLPAAPDSRPSTEEK